MAGAATLASIRVVFEGDASNIVSAAQKVAQAVKGIEESLGRTQKAAEKFQESLKDTPQKLFQLQESMRGVAKAASEANAVFKQSAAGIKEVSDVAEKAANKTAQAAERLRTSLNALRSVAQASKGALEPIDATLGRIAQSFLSIGGAATQFVRTVGEVFRSIRGTTATVAAPQVDSRGMQEAASAVTRTSQNTAALAKESEKASSAMTSLSRSSSSAAQSLQRTDGILAGLQTRMRAVFEMVFEFGIALAAFRGIERLFSGFGNAVINVNAQLERSQVAWTAFTGSAEDAKAVIFAIQSLAAKSPFRFEDLLEGAQRLRNAGVPLANMVPLLWDISTAVAAIGGNATHIDRVTYALMQMLNAGKVSTNEMRQLTEAGIPAWQILADTLNVDVATAMEMVQRRQVDSMTFVMGFSEWVRSNYQDLAENLSRTFSGAMTTIADSANIAIARGFQPIFEAIRNAVVAVAEFAQSDRLIIDWAASVNGAMQLVVQAAQWLAGAFARALSQVVAVVEAIGREIYEALQWLNPFARHSPSLVEQVEEGIQEIIRTYGTADNIRKALIGVRAQIRALESQQRLLNAAMRDLQRELRQAQRQLREYQNALRNVNERIREAEQRIKDLVQATLIEELPFLEQLALYDRRIKELRLQKLRLEFEGAPAAFIEDIETSIEILRKRAEMTDLERELAIGPLREQLEQAADAALGLNQAISFGQALQEISQLAQELVALRQEQQMWQSLVAQQEAVVEGLNDQLEELRDELDRIQDALAELRNFAALLQSALDSLKQTGEQAEGATKRITGLTGAFAILRREMQEVATTPFTVDLSGLDSLAERSRIATQTFTEAIKEIDRLLPGVASRSAEELWAMRKELENAARAALTNRDNLRAFSDALDQAKAALREQEQVLQNYEAALRDVERAISATERAIRGLVDVPLAEEQPYIEQLKELEKQIKQLELQRIELILAGAPEEQIEAVEKQIQQLEAQAKRVDLERELKIEPLRDQLRDMADAALGANQVLTFEQAKQAMLDHIANLQKLREEQAKLNDLVREQQALVSEWRDKVEVLTSVYNELHASASNATEAANNVQLQWPQETAGWLEEAKKKLEEFETKAKSTREWLLQMVQPALPYLQLAGEYLAKFVTVAGGLIILRVGISLVTSLTKALFGLNGGILSLFTGFTGLTNVITLAWMAFENNWLNAATIFKPVADEFQKSFERIKTAFQEGGFAGGIQALADEIVRLTPTVISAIQQLLTNIMTELQKVDWQKVWDTVVETLSTAASALGKLAGAIIQVIVKVLTETDWQKVADEISNAFVTAWQALTGLGEKLWGWLGEQAKTIDWGKVAESIIDLLSAAWSVAKTIGGTILEWLGKTLSEVDWNKVAETVGDAILTALGLLATGAEKFFNWLGNVLGQVDWGKVAETIGDAILAALELLAKGAEKLFNWLSNALSQVDWDKVAQSIADFIGNAIVTIVDIGGKFLDWLTNAISQVDWSSFANKLADVIASAISGLADFGSRIWDAIVGALDKAADENKLATIGEWVGIGLKAGVEGVAPDTGAIEPYIPQQAGPQVGPLATVATVGQEIYNFFQQNEAAQAFVQFLVDQLIPAFNALVDGISQAAQVIKDNFAPTWEQFKSTLESLQPIFQAVIVVGAVAIAGFVVGLRILAEVLGVVLPVAAQIFMSAINIALILIKLVADVITGAVMLIVGILTGDWNKAWEGAKKIVGGIVDAIIGIISQLFNIIDSIFKAIADVIQRIWNGIWSWLRDNIIAPLVVWAVTKFTEFRDKLSDIWNAVKNKVSEIWDGIKTWLAEKVIAIKTEIEEKITTLRDKLGDLWDQVKSKVVEIWDSVKTWIAEKVEAAKQTAITTIAEARDKLATLWEEIKTKVGESWDWVKTKIEGLKDTILNALKWPFEQFRDTIESIFKAAFNFARGPLNRLINGFNTLADAVAGALRWIGEKLGISALTGITWTPIPEIPAYAKGVDYHPGGLALVGEEGPELVELPRGSSVYSARETKAMLRAIERFGQPVYGGILDTVVGGISSIVGEAASLVTDWISKGASWVVEQALGAINFPDVGGTFVGLAQTLINKIREWLTEFVSGLLEKLQEKVISEAPKSWINPVPGGIVTQWSYGTFSHRNIPAVDIAAPRGWPIIAPAAGHVFFLGTNGWSGGTGRTAMIEHGGGWVTLYGHVKSFLPPCTWVRQGEKVGEVGSPELDGGYGSGAHLHFEMFHNGIRVKPEDYIAFAAGGILREPVLGIGLRSGRHYAFAEQGPEVILPTDTVWLQQPREPIEVHVHFNGPVTIEATDRQEAERSVDDIAWAIAQRLRLRGLR